MAAGSARCGRRNVSNGSWLRENWEIEFANGSFVSTSIDLKNKSAGDSYRDKTIEKMLFVRARFHAARVKSRSGGISRTCQLFSQQRTFAEASGTSAQKRTSPGANAEDATVIPAAQPCEARLSDVCGRLKACTAPLVHSAKLRTQA